MSGNLGQKRLPAPRLTRRLEPLRRNADPALFTPGGPVAMLSTGPTAWTAVHVCGVALSGTRGPMSLGKEAPAEAGCPSFAWVRPSDTAPEGSANATSSGGKDQSRCWGSFIL